MIADLRIWVHLGCSEQEKYNPQLVSFTLEFNFKSSPKAVASDQLDDTICYFEIAECVKKLCQQKQFNLIEHLTAEVYIAIEKELGAKRNLISHFDVTLSKLHPPIPGVHGGVSFSYTGNRK